MPDARVALRILLADDHVTVRHGLKLLIDSQADMKVVAEASDGAAAIQHALDLKPDVVVMDISMPGMNGLVATGVVRHVLESLQLDLWDPITRCLNTVCVDVAALDTRPFLN